TGPHRAAQKRAAGSLVAGTRRRREDRARIVSVELGLVPHALRKPELRRPLPRLGPGLPDGPRSDLRAGVRSDGAGDLLRIRLVSQARRARLSRRSVRLGLEQAFGL